MKQLDKLEFDEECDCMSKETKNLLVVLLAMFVLLSVFIGSSKKGTIIEFVDDAVIIASEDGKKVTRIEDYLTYIPTGEQWSVGDKVKIRDGLFSKLRIHRLAE